MSKFGARKFNQDSYDTNDAYGKAIVTAWLKEQSWVKEIIDEEDFGIDLEVVDLKGRSHFFEAEVKGNYPWSNRESFPFKTVSFLGRKKRWQDHQRYQLLSLFHHLV